VRLALNDFTIQQMKGSGGFRLIRDQKVSKAIIEYYNRIVFINYLHDIEANEAEEYRKMAIDIFHPVVFNSIVMPDNTIIRPVNNPFLLTYELRHYCVLQVWSLISQTPSLDCRKRKGR
jgi:hypothetical protein